MSHLSCLTFQSSHFPGPDQQFLEKCCIQSAWSRRKVSSHPKEAASTVLEISCTNVCKLCVWKKGGSDEISQTATSAIVALAMNWDYNYSRYVFEEMLSSFQQKKKNLFLMYPRLLQMIFNEKYPQMERTPNTLDLKALGPNTFSLMKQVTKAKASYQGLKKLVKFRRFADAEETLEANMPETNMETPKTKFVFSIEEIVNVVDDEESGETEENQEKEETGLTQQEREDLIEGLSSHVQVVTKTKTPQQTELIPPQPVVAVESEQEDPTPALVQRNIRRIDPRPGVYVPQTTKDTPTPTPTLTPIEPIPTVQDIPSSVVQEFVEEEVVPTTEFQTGGSLSILFAVDISKGKRKMPDSNFVDVSLLQSRVFELEQDSAEKDLLIEKLDVRVGELEKDNTTKDKKIYELQENLGGLSATYFDLKQRLSLKFGDDFFSQEANVDPRSNVTTPAPDETLAQYISADPLTAEERRENERGWTSRNHLRATHLSE
ncbi:hypothetical protein L2E82_29705 [Cichorium intybus]|uniref:Uncharacterized protein n=1 Tax=Cichorium intybus TaxID=13427 RepID=A0ACB9CYZ3_CICIN|nr:hypothetical protein L2E82_29705 [Cichorium intybus]